MDANRDHIRSFFRCILQSRLRFRRDAKQANHVSHSGLRHWAWRIELGMSYQHRRESCKAAKKSAADLVATRVQRKLPNDAKLLQRPTVLLPALLSCCESIWAQSRPSYLEYLAFASSGISRLKTG